MNFSLTKERRHECCIHEAAHAVINALGDTFVYALVVAPIGASEWTTTYPDETVLENIWGVCFTSGDPTYGCLHYDKNENTFIAAHEKYYNVLRGFPKKRKAELRRGLRAHICGRLAGPIADFINRNTEVDIFFDGSETCDDLSVAEAMTRLLPYRAATSEFDHLATETERMLRKPEIWQAVLNLADELEQTGTLEDDIPYLPEPLKGWPSPPKRKTVHPSYLSIDLGLLIARQ